MGNVVWVFFAARRYWSDADELTRNYEAIKRAVNVGNQESCLVTEEKDLDNLLEGDCLVIVPMSGAVQSLILSVAKRYKTAVLYAACIKGNSEEAAEKLMLEKNAAPTIMDGWAVLRRTHKHALIALDKEALDNNIRVMKAYLAVQGAKLLLVGNTEPWVISNSQEVSIYEKLGIQIQQIGQAEVAEIYHAMTDAAAEQYYKYFKGDERATVEPTSEDICAAARMAGAIMNILLKYKANGIALACFDLLSTGTNSCLGVSYINDCTPYIAACEGDLDSAVTMLAMKQLSSTKLWMANPGLHPEGVINFSHCTAPLNMFGTGKCPYILRNHHESGIGTSLQVEYPTGQVVTACRISDEVSKMTVHRGITIEGEYECACRTQAYVKFDDFKHYLNTVLGCHQIFAFEDICDNMKLLGAQLGLEII